MCICAMATSSHVEARRACVKPSPAPPFQTRGGLYGLERDRAIFGLAYSRKMGESIVPVTLLYSNNGEFSGDTGDQLTINFAMAFELSK